ncbi:MAG: hypothetical protein QNJ75_10725 [Acidimicrobiia bacterium]|nr:hypothetical protein [Acidimicrobiia bacterium]
MALVLVALTVALAMGKSSIVNRFRNAMRHVNVMSGVILVLAGLYIVWFWGTTLVSGATALDNGVFRLVENLSQMALNFVNDNTAFVAITLTLLVSGALITAGRRPGSEENGSDSSLERIDATR